LRAQRRRSAEGRQTHAEGEQEEAVWHRVQWMRLRPASSGCLDSGQRANLVLTPDGLCRPSGASAMSLEIPRASALGYAYVVPLGLTATTISLVPVLAAVVACL
jgi:hypothetical protein